VITDYLIDLLGELQLPPRRRRRILAEVEDHLSCSAAELHAAGFDVCEAEREAVRRFGPAAELARALLDQEAALSGKRAARASGMLAALLAFWLAPAHKLFPWTDGVFPTSLLCFVLVQVAVVAGALTVVRAWREAPTSGPRGLRLALVFRGAVVVVWCAAATVVLGAASGFGSSGQSAAAWLALAGLTAAIAGTCGTLVRSRRLARRAASVGDPADDPAGLVADPLSDLYAVALLALARLERRVPVAHAGLGPAGRRLRTLPRQLAARAPRLCAWFDLGRHPWRFAVSISTAAGLALAAGHGIGEGLSARHPLASLFAGSLIATIEALSALLAFAVLGRFLRIHPQRRQGVLECERICEGDR
jgi:HAAS